MKKAKLLVRRALGALGYDIVRLPHTSLSVHLATLFRDFQIDSVLDVGAHRGEFAKQLRDGGFVGKIISFEPLGKEFRELQEAADDDAGWEARSVALGKETTKRQINVSEASQFSSFLPASGEAADRFPNSRAASQEEVQVERLDSIWSSLALGGSPRVYLKLDTQGWDLEVLEGGAGCLEHIVALQSEIAVRPIYAGAPSLADSLSYITGLGFAATGIFPVVSDDIGRLIEIDCVFVRPEARL